MAEPNTIDIVRKIDGHTYQARGTYSEDNGTWNCEAWREHEYRDRDIRSGIGMSAWDEMVDMLETIQRR
ncbi:MAG: hypothetical protein ACR2RF_06165 [Geminicoccaceae bacterium]